MSHTKGKFLWLTQYIFLDIFELTHYKESYFIQYNYDLGTRKLKFLSVIKTVNNSYIKIDTYKIREPDFYFEFILGHNRVLFLFNECRLKIPSSTEVLLEHFPTFEFLVFKAQWFARLTNNLEVEDSNPSGTGKILNNFIFQVLTRLLSSDTLY